MYKSKKQIDQRNKKTLIKELGDFVSENSFIYSKALKKKVFLDKLPEVILNRKSRVRKSLICFRVAMDILRYSRDIKIKYINSFECFSIKGISQDSISIEVHIRKEKNTKKDIKYLFISCFPNKKPPPH